MCVCGRNSSGKTTFVNSLMGAKVCKLNDVDPIFVPQIYHYKENTQSDTLFDMARNNQSRINITSYLDANGTFVKNEYMPVIHKINNIPNFVNPINKCNYSYSITRMPSLNNSYAQYQLDYLTSTKIDIYIYMINIKSVTKDNMTVKNVTNNGIIFEDIKHLNDICKIIEKNKSGCLFIAINNCDDIINFSEREIPLFALADSEFLYNEIHDILYKKYTCNIDNNIIKNIFPLCAKKIFDRRYINNFVGGEL